MKFKFSFGKRPFILSQAWVEPKTNKNPGLYLHRGDQSTSWKCVDWIKAHIYLFIQCEEFIKLIINLLFNIDNGLFIYLFIFFRMAGSNTQETKGLRRWIKVCAIVDENSVPKIFFWILAWHINKGNISFSWQLKGMTRRPTY